jgi:hypothetical protein
MNARLGALLSSAVVIVSFLGALGLITSCANAGEGVGIVSGPPPAPVTDPPKLDGLLVEMAAASGEPRSEQRARLQKLEQRFHQWGDVTTRLELAWLLSRPGSGFEDTMRAAALLEQYLSKTGTDPVYRALAQVINQSLIDRGKSESAAVLAREESAEEIETLQLQVTTLQGLLETMRQQLEALRDIETTISERKPPEPELLPDDEQSEDSAGR